MYEKLKNTFEDHEENIKRGENTAYQSSYEELMKTLFRDQLEHFIEKVFSLIFFTFCVKSY